MVEGVYPSRPSLSTFLAKAGRGSPEQPVYIAGNEGLAEVTDVNDGVTGLKKGDLALLTKPQSGTWSSCINIAARNLLRVPNGISGRGLSMVHGATIAVSVTDPGTIYSSQYLLRATDQPSHGVQHAS